jgi:hypothetical protein
MAFHMTDCSFRDNHETVFLTCESRDRLVKILASSGMETFTIVKSTRAWNQMSQSDSIVFGFRAFGHIHFVMFIRFASGLVIQ